MKMKRYMLGVVTAGAMALVSCGGESLEDGWDELSEEEQTSICEVFNTDAMTDDVLEEVVNAANDENDTDISPAEFKTFLEDNC